MEWHSQSSLWEDQAGPVFRDGAYVNCRVCRENILPYAADALDATERDELRLHLATGCPSCTGALAEAQAVLALIPRALPSMIPPASARDGLITRIQSPRPARVNRPSAIGLKWLIGTALSSGALAALVTLAVMWRSFREGRQVLESKDLRMVSLAGTEKSGGSRVRGFSGIATRTTGGSMSLTWLLRRRAGRMNCGSSPRSDRLPLGPSMSARAGAALWKCSCRRISARSLLPRFPMNQSRVH